MTATEVNAYLDAADPKWPVALQDPKTRASQRTVHLLLHTLAVIGRPELRNHYLRVTAATMSADAGATVREIQDQLGHMTPQMALRYQTASALRDEGRARRVSEAWGQSSGA